MGHKRVPSTPKEYAKYLYQWPLSDAGLEAAGGTEAVAMIAMRVRAFVDGVNWARRTAKKNRAALNVSEVKP